MYKISHHLAQSSRSIANGPMSHYTTFQIYCYIFGKNTISVPTFSSHSHFGHYFLILLHLVPKIIKRSCFGPYRHLTNGNSLRGKRSTPLALRGYLALLFKQ